MPLNPEDAARIEIPLSEVLPSPAGGVDTGKKPPSPPVGIGHHIKFPWAKEIKAVAIIPDFIVPTAQARAVLPEKYPRQDVVSQSNSAPFKGLHPRQGLTNLLRAADIQPPANRPPPRGLGPVAPGPGTHPSRHAGQDSPAVPPDPHSGSHRSCAIDVSQNAAWVPGRVLVRSRPDNSSAGDEQLRRHCQQNYCYTSTV